MDMVLFSTVVTLASTGISILSILFAINAKRKSQYHTWEKLRKYAKRIAQKVAQDNFIPDVIFTPSAVCSSIAFLVAEKIDVTLPIFVGLREDWQGEGKYLIDIRKYDCKMTTADTNKWRHYIPHTLCKMTDKRILIVDDFVMTGSSLDGIKKQLVACGFDRDNIKTATLLCTQAALNNKTNSDYYLDITDDLDHKFPWGIAT